LVCVLRRENRISLDVRDRNWFVDREMTYPQRQVAANELARKFVDPLLVERGVRSFASPTLGSDEARVALVHLALGGLDEAMLRSARAVGPTRHFLGRAPHA
jgi:hypothetical protein